MLVSKNRVEKFVISIIISNLSMLMLLFLSIDLTSKSDTFIEGLFGICIGVFFLIFLNSIFFMIKKHVFSKVIIVDNELIKVYRGKIIKQIRLDSEVFALIDKGYLYMSMEKYEDFIAQKNKQIFFSSCISFQIDLKNIQSIIPFLGLNQVYYINEFNNSIKNEMGKFVVLIKIS